MNSLLKRQIAKHLKPEQVTDLSEFLNAVNESYVNFEDQMAMQHRAMKISSEELFSASHKLREEAHFQKEINKNLESILHSMNIEDNGSTGSQKTEITEIIKEQSVEIIEINKQRQSLLESLEKQNQALNEYAHMVSHDLKAPLRSIDALLNWFIEDNATKLDEQDLQSLSKIISNVEKMDLLIKGILDYSSVDIDISKHRLIDLNATIKEIKNTIVIPNTIQLTIKGKLPEVKGNAFKFVQLFQNLLQNAIRYNDKEQGLIEIGHNEAEKSYTFYVKDNGVGINAKYFDKIFNVFSKLESNDVTSGIGLSIVKKIVESHGGTIWLESEEGVGSVFYFTILK